MIWCFFAIVNISTAQQYTNYTVKDGLPSNHVYTILQDSKGFMWFLTDMGMVKYNGNTFKTFTTKNGLPLNDVWEAFTTPDGKIWFLAKSSRLGYIEDDQVTAFENKTTDEVIHPRFSYQINNEIYPGGIKNHYKLKDSTWQLLHIPISKGENITFENIIHPKIAYLKSENNAKLKVTDAKENTLLTIPFSGNALVNGYWRSQITDSLYVWTSKTKYTILNLNTLKHNTFTFKNELGIASVEYPTVNLVDGKLQITGSGFVGVLDENFQITDTYFFPKKLQAHFGFIDRQQTLWLATFKNGVYKIPKIKRAASYHFNNEKVQTITTIDNEMYIGVFNKGIYKYDRLKTQFKSHFSTKSFIYDITSIDTLHTIFYITDNEIVAERQSKFQKKIFNYTVNDLFIYNDIKKAIYYNSNVYGFGFQSIYKINYNHLRIEKEIISRGNNDIIVFNNKLLLATTNGIKQIENDTLKPITFNNSIFFDHTSILSIKPISKTKLLVNTDGFGSYITDLETITPIKESEFLIVKDAHITGNNIWLATNTGVLHFKKGRQQYNYIRNYTVNDGLQSNNVNAVYVSNKKLFVGTDNGLAVLPIHNTKTDLFVNVFIDNIAYNNKALHNSNYQIHYNSDANLRINFSTINFSEEDTNNYEYKLEPLQSQWNTTTTSAVNFNNLNPGTYEFYLKSNNLQKSKTFIIKPLWWQTIWAKLLIGVFSIALILLVVWQLSKKAQEKRNSKFIQEKRISEIQLKALRSQMNPHFVFNSLSAIQYYINNNEIEASEGYLVKFSKLIRQFFELSKETEIPLNEEINLLTNYLDIEKLRFKNKFQYQINTDSKLKINQSKLPTMLLQPIVENAVNHGVFNKLENGTITVNFIQNSKNSIKVEIIDDGVGYVNTKKKSKRKVKSSNVLEDRLKFLNQTGLWHISYTKEELHPEQDDKGNKSTFIITQL